MSLFILIISFVAALISIATDHIAAPDYGVLFGVAEFSGALAIACAVYLVCAKSRYSFVGIVPAVIGLYAMIDFFLRRVFGILLVNLILS